MDSALYAGPGRHGGGKVRGAATELGDYDGELRRCELDRVWDPLTPLALWRVARRPPRSLSSSPSAGCSGVRDSQAQAAPI